MDNNQDFQNEYEGRDGRGRFAAGNKAALGHGTRSRDNLFTFRECITEDDIRELAAMLLKKAKSGDFKAIHLLLTYCLPQPASIYRVDEKRALQESSYRHWGKSFD